MQPSGIPIKRRVRAARKRPPLYAGATALETRVPPINPTRCPADWLQLLTRSPPPHCDTQHPPGNVAMYLVRKREEKHLRKEKNVTAGEGKCFEKVGKSLVVAGPGLSSPPDHEFCWEYLFLAAEIARGLAKHEDQYREHEEHRTVPTGEQVSDPAADVTKRLEVFGSICSNGCEFLSQQHKERAFGSTLSDGSEEGIRTIALGIEEMYVALMDWAQATRGVDVPRQFLPTYQALSNWSDFPIRQIRRFSVDWTCLAGDLVRAKRAGIPYEPFSLTLEFEVDENAEAQFAQAVRNATK